MTKLCSTSDCPRSVMARGLCAPHYSAWHRAQKKYTIECAECGRTVSVGRKGMKYCSTVCANRFNARAWHEEQHRQRGQEFVMHRKHGKEIVPYVKSGRPRADPVHIISNTTFVSGQCMVCRGWFVSENRRDRTCSQPCREAHALDIKRQGKHRRRAMQRDAYVADVNRRQVYERDGWRCHLCGKAVSKNAKAPHPRSATIDHVIPLSKGGKHEPLNCRTACFRCNTVKGARGGGEQLLLIA